MKWKSVILVLLLSNIYCFFEVKRKNEFIKVLSNSIVGYSARIYKLYLLEEARKYELNIDGCDIPLNCELLDEYSKKRKLKDILDGNNKLVLRFTDLDCHTCIEEQIQKLDSYVDSIGINNIIYIVSTDNPVYLKGFKLRNNIKVSVYKISKEKNRYFEDIGLPYFFVLTLDGKITHTFVPYKEMPEYTNDYLHIIYKRYFNVETH